MISDSGGGGPSRADGALEPKLLLEGFPRIAIRRVAAVVRFLFANDVLESSASAQLAARFGFHLLENYVVHHEAG